MALFPQDEVIPGVGYFTSNSLDVKRISRRALIRGSMWGTAAIAIEKTLIPCLTQSHVPTVKAMTAATSATGLLNTTAPALATAPVHPTVYATLKAVSALGEHEA